MERAQQSVERSPVQAVPETKGQVRTAASPAALDRIHQLQRSIGNQAVGRLFATGRIQAKPTLTQSGDPAELEADRVAEALVRTPPGENRAASISTAPPGPAIQRMCAVQTKLTVNRPGDEFEREADRVAEQVVGAPASIAVPSNHSNAPAAVQMKALGSPAPMTTAEPPIVHGGLRSPGHAPDTATRAFMEPRMGFDLSRVRVHTDAAAAESASAISARAYTSGVDIVFAQGQYRPETTEGRKLLAHELTHVAQQCGSQASVQRKEETPEQKPHNTRGTGPSIVRIEADPKQTGAAWGYFADGNSILIEILKNKLDAGQYTVRSAGRSEGPDDAAYVKCESPTFAWRQPVANFLPTDVVTVIIRRTTADRFAQLPEYIKGYLLTNGMFGLSKLDLETLADEGERLVKEGITEADLALAEAPGGRIEMEGKAPPDPDLVESLRRRGFSDFPSREEYYKGLASQLVNSSDYRSWWTKADIAAYWKEFPEVAAADWNNFADTRYTEAKQAEEASWLEAFRRIDAAAGAVNAIAVVTLVVAGGFAGAEIISVLPAVPALPATIQGVPTAFWGKTLFAAGLSASYLGHIYTRSKEASEHGGVNPFLIAIAAVDDTTGGGKLYEVTTNESLLTREHLNMSPTERIVGGLMGGVDLTMNALGASDLIVDPIPTFKPPSEPTPAAGAQARQPVASAQSGPAPWTADEIAAMQKQDITSMADVKAAREANAEELRLAQEQQQSLEIAQEQAQPRAAQMSRGGSSRSGPTRTNAPRTSTSRTSSSSSSGASQSVKQSTVFKRVGPSAGQRVPYDLEAAGAEADQAHDIYESLEDLKNRDPGQEGKLIKGEFGPDTVAQKTPGLGTASADRVARLRQRFTTSDLQALDSRLAESGAVLNDEMIDALIKHVPPGKMKNVLNAADLAETGPQMGTEPDLGETGSRVDKPRPPRGKDPVKASRDLFDPDYVPQNTSPVPPGHRLAEIQADRALRESFPEGTWTPQSRFKAPDAEPGTSLGETRPDWYNAELAMSVEVKKLDLAELGIGPDGRVIANPSEASVEALARARGQFATRRQNLPGTGPGTRIGVGTEQSILFNVTGEGVTDMFAFGRQLRQLLAENLVAYDRVFVQNGRVLVEIP